MMVNKGRFGLLVTASAVAMALSAAPALAKAHHRDATASHVSKGHNGKGRHGRAERADTPITQGYPILSQGDAEAYNAAFRAAKAGDFDTAEHDIRHVKDPCLKGRILYIKLMHADYAAEYGELAAWLKKYKDLPDATRVYNLAYKKKPAHADLDNPDDTASGAAAGPWANIRQHKEHDLIAPVARVDPGMQAGRDAFYNRGDVVTGHDLAVRSGDAWVAGIAAFRLKRYGEAKTRLAGLAVDMTQNEWVRSAAAFWAARAAIANGEPARAPALLQIAARTPWTFYGLIAERQLGLDPGVTQANVNLGEPDGQSHADDAPASGTLGGGATTPGARWVRGDKRAHRAVAYAQIGLRAEATQEIRAALNGAGPEERRRWRGLSIVLGLTPAAPGDLRRGSRHRFDLAQYPAPDLQPQGGFIIDRALVYAIVRQESGFNADAASNAGAYGLMQLMPATAARVAGDDKFTRDPANLRDPAVNLRLGQAYVANLLNITQGDILRAVGSYNAGPGVILKTRAAMGLDTDSLLVIESMPGGQTREFVQKVVAGYWIYRQIFGADSRTLDAAASGARTVLATLDTPTPIPPPPPVLAPAMAPAPDQGPDQPTP